MNARDGVAQKREPVTSNAAKGDEEGLIHGKYLRFNAVKVTVCDL